LKRLLAERVPEIFCKTYCCAYLGSKSHGKCGHQIFCKDELCLWEEKDITTRIRFLQRGKKENFNIQKKVESHV